MRIPLLNQSLNLLPWKLMLKNLLYPNSRSLRTPKLRRLKLTRLPNQFRRSKEVAIPALATQEINENETTELLPALQPIVQPSIPAIDALPATEPEAHLEQAKLDKTSVDSEKMQG